MREDGSVQTAPQGTETPTLKYERPCQNETNEGRAVLQQVISRDTCETIPRVFIESVRKTLKYCDTTYLDPFALLSVR